MPGDGNSLEGWSSEDKFAIVLETVPLNAAELAKYCRRKGLYPEQISSWRAACRSATANATEQAREQRRQSKNDKKRIQQLEKELRRKEKALAEATALLILRKKAQAIWADKAASMRVWNSNAAECVTMCLLDKLHRKVGYRFQWLKMIVILSIHQRDQLLSALAPSTVFP